MSAFIKPEEAIKCLDLYGNMKVADLGCGAGHFSICAAAALPGGKIFSIDIQQEPMSVLRGNAADAGIENIYTICADIEAVNGSKLKSESIDRVILANILNQNIHKQAAVSEAFRILKKSGKLLIVDWIPAAKCAIGPAKQNRVSEAGARAMAERAGGTRLNSYAFGDFHYGIILNKS